MRGFFCFSLVFAKYPFILNNMLCRLKPVVQGKRATYSITLSKITRSLAKANFCKKCKKNLEKLN